MWCRASTMTELAVVVVAVSTMNTAGPVSSTPHSHSPAPARSSYRLDQGKAGVPVSGAASGRGPVCWSVIFVHGCGNVHTLPVGLAAGLR
jgi:hypothetical protein